MSNRSTYYTYLYPGDEHEDFRERKNKRSTRKKAIFLFLSILVLVYALNWIGPPTSARASLDNIDISNDPVQTIYNGGPITKEISGYAVTILPLANYQISGVLESKRYYYPINIGAGDRFYAKIAPVDLCLSWGKIAEPENDKYISFSQSKRWCSYYYTSSSPFKSDYINSHSGNNHVIPSNENIYKAIKTIEEKDKVVLKGFLVNVLVKNNGRETTFLKSSLTRNDEGDGACEVFYVNEVRIGNMIYE